jgi:hypothetical protein
MGFAKRVGTESVGVGSAMLGYAAPEHISPTTLVASLQDNYRMVADMAAGRAKLTPGNLFRAQRGWLADTAGAMPGGGILRMAMDATGWATGWNGPMEMYPGAGLGATGPTGIGVASSGIYGSQAGAAVMAGALAQGEQNPVVALLQQIAQNTKDKA